MIRGEEEAEWDAWERRNPGVAHPGRAQASRQRGRQEHDRDWEQGTLPFRRDPRTLGERAREVRQRGRGTQVPRASRAWDELVDSAETGELLYNRQAEGDKQQT